MTYKRRINVRGIIFTNGKLFVQRLKGSDRDYWCTPGGGMDDGESLHEGLHREMVEETGIAPVIGKLLFIQQFHDGVKEQLEFFFHITNTDDYSTIDLTQTTHGMIEVESCGFINPRANNVLPAILQTIDIQAAIDSGSDVIINSDL